MIDHIFVLTIYAYSSYSYSGIMEISTKYFLSLEGAEDKAKSLRLKIVRDIKNPENECTITQETIYP